MVDHSRTRIKALTVRGYRSLRKVELRDLTDLVVLTGPNGSGKSSVLGALRLVLRAAAYAGSEGLATSREKPAILSLSTADEVLDLRPDDFSRGEVPEIRVAVDVALGSWASIALELTSPGVVATGSLFLDLVVQDAGDRKLRFWFERADLDDRIGLAIRGPLPLQHVSMPLAEVRDLRDRLTRELATRHEASPGPLVAMRAAVEGAESRVAALEARAAAEALVGERAQKALVPRLVHAIGAHRAVPCARARVPGTREDPTLALYHALLSEDPQRRAAARSVGVTLGELGLFGARAPGGEPIELMPIEAKTYGEEQVRLRHPRHGSLSVRNLGAGEQQLFCCVAELALTPSPIVTLENPEAHLQLPLAEALVGALHRTVESAAIDQLWLATHQHSIHLVFRTLQLALVDGWTVVTPRPERRPVPA